MNQMLCQSLPCCRQIGRDQWGQVYDYGETSPNTVVCVSFLVETNFVCLPVSQVHFDK